MIVACHCEGTGWKFWGDSNLKSKFWGRSIQLDPVGMLTLEFDDGEVFQWSKVYIIWFNCYPALILVSKRTCSFRLLHQYTISYWESYTVIIMVQCVYRETKSTRVN